MHQSAHLMRAQQLRVEPIIHAAGHFACDHGHFDALRLPTVGIRLGILSTKGASGEKALCGRQSRLGISVPPKVSQD